MMSNAVFQNRRLQRLLPLLFAILFSTSFLLSAFPFPLQEAPSQTEEVDPFYLKLFKEGKYFFQNGKYDEAIKSFEIASFGFIDNPRMILDCYVHLAVAHFKLKNMEKAKYYLDEINRQELPEHLAAAQLPKELLDEYINITSRLTRPEGGSQEQAARQPKSAPIEKPASPTPATSGTRLDEIDRVRKEKAERFLSEARRQKDLGRKTDLYIRALEQDTSDVDVYFELSGVLRDGKRYKQAAQVITVLIEAGISDPRIPIELGTVHLLNKKYDQAIAALSEGRSSGNDSLELSYLLANAYLGKKMYREAESELARLVERSPDYRDAAALLRECRKNRK